MVLLLQEAFAARQVMQLPRPIAEGLKAVYLSLLLL